MLWVAEDGPLQGWNDSVIKGQGFSNRSVALACYSPPFHLRWNIVSAISLTWLVFELFYDMLLGRSQWFLKGAIWKT